MPAKVTHVTGGVRVRWGGKIVASATTPAKAKAQVKLLRAIEHGYKPKAK